MPEPPFDEEIRGFRLTPQRRAILRVLREAADHPDATWIYERVRKELPHISLGTVYRNLSLLAEEGLIREIPLGHQPSRWDGRTDPHAHAICQRCGRVVDVELCLPQEVFTQVAESTGFRLLDARVLFEGLCPACQAQEREEGAAED